MLSHYIFVVEKQQFAGIINYSQCCYILVIKASIMPRNFVGKQSNFAIGAQNICIKVMYKVGSAYILCMCTE